MTKQVYKRDMVAHIWANAGQDSARDACKNLFFNGPAIFSYGHHFVIAYRLARGTGSPLFIVNADTYSVTTSRHQSIVRRAIPGAADEAYIGGLSSDTFNAPNWKAGLIVAALEQAGDAFDSAGRVSRVSHKRDGMTGTARTRLDAAELVARASLDAAVGATYEDKKAARRALKLIEQARAVEMPDDNKGQQAACFTLAKMLRAEKAREQMRDLVTRAWDAFEEASREKTHFTSYARMHERAKMAEQRAGQALSIADNYGFKRPKLPNATALVDALWPHVVAEHRAETVRQMGEELRLSELAWHARTVNGEWDWRIGRSIQNLTYRSLHPSEFPELASQLARLESLAAKARRRRALADAVGHAGIVSNELKTAASYVDGGYIRDAVNHYGRAAHQFASYTATLPATHPARALFESLRADVERGEEYVMTAREKLAAELAADIEAWRNGERSSLPSGARDLGPMLRKRDNAIETSWGATVPASVAPLVWRLVSNARRLETAHAFNGDAPRLGHFTMSRVNADGSIIVGCHAIAYGELERMAREFGFINSEMHA